jgi:ABC-type glycerol-3-phosphate transport system substrate-binding protein
MIESVSIGDGYYFLSGDMSTNVLYMMHCMFINKDMFSQFQIDLPYKTVRDGKWTIDKMSELASNAYSDLNGNSVADINDSFGIGLRKNTMFDGFFLGADLRSIEKDANGTMIIADEFTSERTVDLLTKLVAIFHESNYTAFPQTVEGWTNAIFANGQVLFMVDLGNVTSSTEVAGTSVNYGVLPVPKYDEQQERYITGLQSGYTMYSASITVDDATRDTIGAMIECMASESYRQVIPAVYETTMKLKYSSGENDARMYDLIRAGITFDLGNIFAEPLEKITYYAFRKAANDGATNWVSLAKAQSKVMQNRLDALVETLANLPE